MADCATSQKENNTIFRDVNICCTKFKTSFQSCQHNKRTFIAKSAQFKGNVSLHTWHGFS